MNNISLEDRQFFDDNYGFDMFADICLLYDDLDKNFSNIFFSTKPNELYNFICDNIDYNKMSIIEDGIYEENFTSDEEYN